jgi:hypothetical protein
MVQFLYHLILLIAAGFALFFLWRKTNLLGDPWINRMIAAGFVARAVLAQGLFWISYARLPIARSLQMGDGIWFFAVDALQYYPQALKSARDGAWAIVNYPRGAASVSFVQALSGAILLFGEVASVAVLLNLFCFLGTAYLITRWAAPYDRARIATRIAIGAIALSPAFILWSLQPLKDTMFQFIVVAFVAACAAWQRAWISVARRWWLVGIAALICTTMYLLAGIRWYFAFAILIGSCAFFLSVAFRAAGRKTVAFGSAVALLLLLSRAFLFGAGPYVPDPIRNSLMMTLNHPLNHPASKALPGSLAHEVESARTAFEHSGGATQIALGGELARLDVATRQKGAEARSDHPQNSRRSRPQHRNTGAEAGKTNAETGTALLLPRLPAALQPHASGAEPITTPQIEKSMVARADPPRPKPETMMAHPKQSAVTPAHEMPSPTQAAPPAAAPATATTIAAARNPAAKSDEASSIPAQDPPKTPRVIDKNPAVKSQSARTPVVVKPSRSRTTKPPAVVAPTVSLPKPATPLPAAAVIARKPITPPVLAPAVSRTGRLFAGAAALLVPSSIGQRIGLFQIGGGHSVLWFSDLDTIVFDLVAFAAIFWFIRSFRFGSLRNPIFWMIAAVTLSITVPLVYTVSNFGTLFRLRGMIYLGLVLIPLSLATVQKQTTPV